ncbi:NupC/NupG family nucleoside CNT transporter [Falsiroseomonas stagni]|uniref:Concentrative nucleoside transporter, CNT family n=1 Tax=Falsiroseomonas stagni DSM 19981 TaxID=1123062 RepID=A0A1I4ABH3_9PROT|nr:nucleoside transporter C-terminal domain-containing protein [Falsiroseomonas stagni]SFK53758.1 concentrative nucleoside transporter, CNT family [Falsiroseomonas stagni DSM 19981]
MSALQIQSGLGLLALALLAWVLGGCRRGVPWRVILAGLVLQIVLAAALLHIAPLRAAFALIGRAVDALAAATKEGTTLVFGYLGGGPLPFAEPFPGAGFILFFQGLPLVLVVGALSALLYHWRILPVVVAALAKVLSGTLGIGGATGFSVAANVFVGMVEAPLLIRPWLARLTTSEMFVVMTAGLATISGNMLVVYAFMIAPVVPDAAGQLLVASLIAAPASIVAALLMIPPRPGEVPDAGEQAEAPRLYDSAMEAVVRGTMDGLQLLFGIMAMLIVFVALVALVNMVLEPVTGLTLQVIAAWLFWPLAFAMGVPLEHVGTVAQSLGIKVVVNEFVSYLQLATSGGQGLDGRSRLILTYALCGFTNFGSVGIMLGGMTAMVPERRADIVRLGLPALVAAMIACCMTGAVVGMLVAP